MTGQVAGSIGTDRKRGPRKSHAERVAKMDKEIARLETRLDAKKQERAAMVGAEIQRARTALSDAERAAGNPMPWEDEKS